MQAFFLLKIIFCKGSYILISEIVQFDTISKKIKLFLTIFVFLFYPMLFAKAKRWKLLTANPLPNVSKYAVFAIVAVFAMQVWVNG